MNEHQEPSEPMFPDPGMIASATGMRARNPWEMEDAGNSSATWQRMGKPVANQRTTIGSLAAQLDLPPRDVLDAALEAGVSQFWHEGQQFRTAVYLRTWLALRHSYDPVPELEFEMTPAVDRWIAEVLAEQNVTTIKVPVAKEVRTA